MDTAKKNRKLEQLIESVRNQLESTKYTKSVIIKPKDEVIYDRCVFAQLLTEIGRFGAQWVSWFGVFVVPDYEESSLKARQESPQDKTIETVKRGPEFDQMLDKIGNMIESTQYVGSLLVKPKNDSIVSQLYQELTPVGAVWFSSVGVFVVPEREESGSPIIQGVSQVETVVSAAEESSSKHAGALLNDEINREFEKLKVYFGRKMTKTEACKSVAFLLSKGFKPEEIAAKLGVGRATIYRYIPKEKAETSVST